MAKRLRSLLLFPLLIAGCSILGGLYGPALAGSSSASATSEDDVNASIKTFTKVYSLIEQNAAEQISPDKALYKGAIPGMLRTLDPHSSFFDPRDFKLLREEQKGHYYGVGMQIGPSRTGNGKTICISPFPGSPAYKAGIRPGDTILAVSDKNTEKMTLTEIADLLKGPRNTQVKVTIGREGTDKPLLFTLTRDEIPRKTVQDAMWLKPGVAYLDIESFNETTSKDVDDSLRKLPETEIKGLVLDLRNNPGGLLNEGVAVADRWLQKGQLIVSHRGRASAEKDYKARNGNQGRDYPIVILVNQYSASAAEIVSGALQDHDRAWVLGDNTFGKGLVQTVYPLAEDSGLALTTAKYYTPSGRLIQRDYSGISFLDYYYHRNPDQKNAQDVKMTDSGRTVYGGGGITPDEKFTGPKLDRFQLDTKFRKYAFFNFVARYLGKNGTNLPKTWTPSQEVMNQFHEYLLKDAGVTFTEADFAKNSDWIKQELRREVYSSAFGIDDARRFEIEVDPVIAKAIESLPKAKALVETARRVIAQRVSTDR